MVLCKVVSVSFQCTAIGRQSLCILILKYTNMAIRMFIATCVGKHTSCMDGHVYTYMYSKFTIICYCSLASQTYFRYSTCVCATRKIRLAHETYEIVRVDLHCMGNIIYIHMHAYMYNHVYTCMCLCKHSVNASIVYLHGVYDCQVVECSGDVQMMRSQCLLLQLRILTAE